MSENTQASAGYALGRLARALATATEHEDPEIRERARAKAERWQLVLEGFASGKLEVGSRTPVADTPTWVTLEVVHGGFATGRYLAESELLEHERALVDALPPAVRGRTPRERLNRWYLGDAGQTQLSEAVEEGRYRVEIPEEGALLVVAALLERGHDHAALELVEELQPLMHRLRFYPRLEPTPRPRGACVRLRSVREVAAKLRAREPQPRVVTMNEALRVWNPLFDRLVALWLDTVEGPLPDLQRDAEGALVRRAGEQPIVIGGWPCRRWPADWATRRAAWLRDYERAQAEHHRCGKHSHPRSHFSRLRAALLRCEHDSAALDGREVGRVRLALANTIAKHGAPGSPARTRLRQGQAEVAARPLQVDVAAVVADRVERYPAEGGLPSLDDIAEPVREGEREHVPAGTPVPASILPKVARALEAPIAELVEREVIRSSEVLAIVLPQISSQVAAAGIRDPALRQLFAEIYAAFRRRRSLLLLDLPHQVQLEELPWVAALEPFRAPDLGAEASARQTLEQVTLLALSAFPQTIFPNPLVREMQSLATRAGLELPLVEEVAADIFTGTFTAKWAAAASRTAATLAGSLYARYYDLPAPNDPVFTARARRWRKHTADGFAKLCVHRAREAHHGSGSWVAANGAILEQSQILTTHNLAVLVDALDLWPQLRLLAPGLVEIIFAWILRRFRQRPPTYRARLQMIKNTAYAWRQAIFLLSLCDQPRQRELVTSLGEQLEVGQVGQGTLRLLPAYMGLRMALDGGRFDEQGRAPHGARGWPYPDPLRWLGWSVGPHPLLASQA
jgi:hypothetical protein